MIMRISFEVLSIHNNHTTSESHIQKLSLSLLNLLLHPISIDITTGRDAALKVDNSLIEAAHPLSRELRLARRVLQYSEQRGKSNKTYTAVFGKLRYATMSRRANKADQIPLNTEKMIKRWIISLNANVMACLCSIRRYLNKKIAIAISTTAMTAR